MSPLVTFTYDLEDGVDLALGSEVLANLEALKTVVHGLDYQNLGPNPQFPGTCISSSPGSRVPETRLENKAVTDRVLSWATLDADNLQRAVNNEHIRLEAVQKKNVAPSTLTHAQMDLAVQATAGSITFNPTSTLASIIVSGRKISGGNLAVQVTGFGTSPSLYWFAQSATIVSSPALPSASYVFLGAYVDMDSIVDAGATYTFNVIFVALKIA